MRGGFGPSGYLKDRWPTLLSGALSMAGVFLMARIFGTGAAGCIALAVFMALTGIAALALDYGRRRSFWKETVEAVEAMERADQFTTFLEEPLFLEGRLAYNLGERVATLANEEISEARRASSEYRDYIELWIHEIKTPIAASRLVLARMAGPDADVLSRSLERVESSVEQALYYARSTKAASDYAVREISLAAVVREACKRHARFLLEHGTVPVIEIDADATVLSDKLWMTFMVGQVAVNAAQYGATRVTFTAWEENAGTSDERSVLEIRDDGAGIPEEDVPRVFDRGFTGSNGHARGSSTGMGLYLVALMASRLGLGVAVASEVGVGTRVLLSFPHDRRFLDR